VVLTESIRRSSLGRLGAVLIMAAALAGCGNTQTVEGQIGPQLSHVMPTSVPISVLPSVSPSVQPFVPGPLTDPGLDLRAGPVDVPLELRIPSLQLSAPVVGVGITSENVMDAPNGPADDPVWHTVFWYRGGGIPGDVGTATITGHVTDSLGRPAIFIHLGELLPGDPILVHDPRSGRSVRFTVTEMESYTVAQANDPSVLERIYGAGPVSGTGPQPSPDGLSHLTLITCSGRFDFGSFDRRLIVYATRSD